MDAPVINLMNALAAPIVAAVCLFIRHQQQSPCSALIWKGQLICIVDVFAAESILQLTLRQPPAVQTVCGGLMFSVSFVLVPSNLLHLVPSFLTLWPELNNGRSRGFMKRVVILFLKHGFVSWRPTVAVVTCTWVSSYRAWKQTWEHPLGSESDCDPLVIMSDYDPYWWGDIFMW